MLRGFFKILRLVFVWMSTVTTAIQHGSCFKVNTAACCHLIVPRHFFKEFLSRMREIVKCNGTEEKLEKMPEEEDRTRPLQKDRKTIWKQAGGSETLINHYSQAKSSVPPPPPAPKDYITEFIIRKLNPLVVVDFRFISAFFTIFACVMSREFTRKAVTKFLPAGFPWIWCKCLLWNLTHSKIFNLTKYREVLVKLSLLITLAGMPIWI